MYTYLTKRNNKKANANEGEKMEMLKKEKGITLIVLVITILFSYDEKFLQDVLAKITWYHNVILMDKVKDIEERKWYISQTIKNGWSTNILKNQIKNKLYERQAIADKTTNFENTLPDIQSDLALQTLKDPYIFDFIALKGQVKEKEIEEAMITKIKNVLLELRNRFCLCRKSI